MMYAVIIVMSIVACFLGFMSGVTSGNIVHIKHGRKPEAGASIFPTIPCVQIFAVLLAWGLNHLYSNLGFYTVIALCVLLYVMWIVTYPKLKRQLAELKKNQIGEPPSAASAGRGP